MSSVSKSFRRKSARIATRENKRLSVDESACTSSEIAEDFSLDKRIDVDENFQTSPEVYRDLFGEPIPKKPKITPASENNSRKNTPVSKKKKEPNVKLFSEKSVKRPTRVVKLQKDAQADLQTCMTSNASSSDVSTVISLDKSLNVSGIEELINSPTPNKLLNDFTSYGKSSVLEGTYIYIDYKINNKQDNSLKACLNQFGSKVQRTFTNKVTHVLFHEGRRKTYDKAMARNIPLVSAGWIDNSVTNQKLASVEKFPSVSLAKYAAPQPIKIDYKKIFTCTKFHKLYGCTCEESKLQLHNIMKSMNSSIDTYKLFMHINTQRKDLITTISRSLCKLLNSPIPDKEPDKQNLVIPRPIRLLRRHLTPYKKMKTPIQLDNDLVKIENRLNLNSQARLRLRKLLFPYNDELHNMTITDDDSLQSPQKIEISTPNELTNKKQRKTPIKTKPVNNKTKKAQETITSMITSNSSMTLQIPNAKSSPNILQTLVSNEIARSEIKTPIKTKPVNNKTKKAQETITSTITSNSSMTLQIPNAKSSPNILQTLVSNEIARSGTKTPIKTEPVNNKTKIAQETITSTISSNASMTLQTPNANSSPTVLQTLDCTEMARSVTKTPLNTKPVKNGRKNIKDIITSMISSNCSMTLKDSPIVPQTIACTGMTRSETIKIMQYIEDLGTFSFHIKVIPTTTYLITKMPLNRTINLVFGMAYGCYIISEDWIYESSQIGKWLPFEQYIINELSEPVKVYQTQRQTIDRNLKFNIFGDAGNIFISDVCEPKPNQLKQLVRICGGKCVNNSTAAKVLVGFSLLADNYIHERWILDCITQGSLLDQTNYIVANNEDHMRTIVRLERTQNIWET